MVLLEKRIFYLRHVDARVPEYIREIKSLPGAKEGTQMDVGFGMYVDGESHVTAKGVSQAVAMGSTLPVPTTGSSIALLGSTLPRTIETNRFLFEELCRRHSKEVLGITNPYDMSSRVIHSRDGLASRAVELRHKGLDETDYKNSLGESDEVAELVAQMYNPEINKGPKDYRFMVQAGFDRDPRSEHPLSVAKRGLVALVRTGINHDVTIANGHQPNTEITVAYMTRAGLGSNANEVWNNAGGSFGLGGGIFLHLAYDAERKCIVDATMKRTPSEAIPGNPKADKPKFDFMENLEVDIDVLNSVLKFR